MAVKQFQDIYSFRKTGLTCHKWKADDPDKRVGEADNPNEANDPNEGVGEADDPDEGVGEADDLNEADDPGKGEGSKLKGVHKADGPDITLTWLPRMGI